MADDDKRSFTPGRSEPASGKSVFEIMKEAETAEAVKKVARNGTITGPKLKAALGPDYEAMTPRQAANLAWRVKNNSEYREIIDTVRGVTDERREGAMNRGALKAMSAGKDDAPADDKGTDRPMWRRHETMTRAARAAPEKTTGAYIGQDGLPHILGLPDIGERGGARLDSPRPSAELSDPFRTLPNSSALWALPIDKALSTAGSAGKGFVEVLEELSPPRQAELAGQAFAKGQDAGDPVRMAGALTQGLLGGVAPVLTAGASGPLTSMLFGSGARTAGTVGASTLGGAAAAGILSPTPAQAQAKGKKKQAEPDPVPPAELDPARAARWVELNKQLKKEGSLPRALNSELRNINDAATEASKASTATANAIALKKADTEAEATRAATTAALQLKQQTEQARLDRELREKSANTSIKSEHPWFAPVAAAVGGGAGAGLAFLASKRATTGFNSATDDLAARSKLALDDAKNLMRAGHTGDAHLRLEEAAALDKELRGMLGAGPDPGKAPYWASIGGAELGLNAPNVADYIKALPGSELKKNAFGEPLDMAMRIGGGAVTGAALGKMASVAGGLGRSDPTTMGVHGALDRIMTGKGSETLGHLSQYADDVAAANIAGARHRQAMPNGNGTGFGQPAALAGAHPGAAPQVALPVQGQAALPPQIPQTVPYDISVHHPISKKVIMDALDLSTPLGKQFRTSGNDPVLLTGALRDAHRVAGAPEVDLPELQALAQRWITDVGNIGQAMSAGRAVTNPLERGRVVAATSGKPGQLAIPGAIGAGATLGMGSPEAGAASAGDLQAILDRINTIAQKPAGTDLEAMLAGLSDTGEWPR